MIAIETRRAWFAHGHAEADVGRAPTGQVVAIPLSGTWPPNATMPQVLAEWRAAERALAGCPLDASERFVMEAAAAACRDTYQAMFEQRCPRGRPAAGPVAVDWDAAFRWLVSRATAVDR